MITVVGEGNGFPVVWLLEEMGLTSRMDLDFHLPESPRSTAFLAEVGKNGGHWERHMGGARVISRPTASTIDAHDFLNRRAGRAGAGPRRADDP